MRNSLLEGEDNHRLKLCDVWLDLILHTGWMLTQKTASWQENFTQTNRVFKRFEWMKLFGQDILYRGQPSCWILWSAYCEKQECCCQRGFWSAVQAWQWCSSIVPLLFDFTTTFIASHTATNNSYTNGLPHRDNKTKGSHPPIRVFSYRVDKGDITY